MSSKHLPSALRACASLLACCALAACSVSKGSAALNDWERDASFGNGADDPDAGHEVDGSAGDGDGDGPLVRLRLVHGLINLPELGVCHDPDRIIDVPETVEDEAADGAAPARFLGLMGAFGLTTEFADEAAMKTGTLSLHRLPPAPVGDAGVGDAGAADAGSDGGLPDAGSAPEAPVDRCDPSTREAVLPLPFAGNWLDPKAPLDLAESGIATTLEGGQTITLLASGLALDGEQVLARADEAKKAFLVVHPGDDEGADAAAALELATIEADLGPRVVPALHGSTRDAEGPFALSFAHLVPDVPTGSVEDELPSDYPRSGALRLCVKIDDVEQQAQPAQSAPGLPFRTRSPVELATMASLSYTFRVFAADAFDGDAKDCAGTSLAPVAELDVSALAMVPGRAYTLAAVGAIAPDELCTPASEGALARQSCPVAAADLKVRLVLLAD